MQIWKSPSNRLKQKPREGIILLRKQDKVRMGPDENFRDPNIKNADPKRKSYFHTLFFETSRECFGGRNENGRRVRKE